MANRKDSWSVLLHLASQYDLLWVCIGDFNEILKVDEILGGTIQPKGQLLKFRDCLDYSGLKDLSFTGFPYTWCSRRFNGALVWVRLDRALASAEWILKFPFACLHHIPGSSSDHKSIWLVSDDVQSRFYQPQNPSSLKLCGSRMSDLKAWFMRYGI